jgi:SpoVK/Ycf46/Vps4 family AAA+-type ATPase
VERWNAVLLFDECDVFLSKRGDDIHQSAVVGMFLRLMDYYSGTMFLTTNRLGVVDEAVDSRLAFRIHYEDLSEPDRLNIWKGLLAEANVAALENVLKRLSQLDLDGRKIRNMVRAIQLTKILKLTWDHVEALLPYIEFVKK